MGCVLGDNLGARIFDRDQLISGSRIGLGGWSAFLAFIIVFVQIVMIILRFLNFAATFWYPLLFLLLVSTLSVMCMCICVCQSVLQGIQCD